MRETKRSRWSLRAGVLSAVGVAAVAALLFLALAPQDAVAGPGPKVVRGYVWDSLYNPVPDADVTVHIRRASDNAIRATLTDTTNETGMYSVTFAMGVWDIGDTIEVRAVYGGHENTNTSTATDSAIDWVNVTLAFVIPEFGSLSPLILTGSIALIAGVAILARRRG